MKRNAFWMLVGIAAALVVINGVAFARPYQLRGSQIEPPIPAYTFALPASNGQTFALDPQSGKITLLFFGYTTCPDVCPATLSEMKQVRQKLGGQADNVQVVFITVDPQRDTPDKLKAYLAGFDPTFIGVSAGEVELQPVWQAYGVMRQIRPVSGASGYLVDHSARLYLVDRSGRLRLTYSFGTPVDDITQDVRYLLREG